MGLDLTSFNDALKEYYTPRRIENMTYQDNAFLALVPKSTKFPGKLMPIPIIYGNPASTGADFSTAQTLASTNNSRVERFELTRVKRYGVVLIDGETMKATEDDAGAFLKAATTEIDGVVHQLKRNLAVQLFRGGWGAIGVVATGGISGATITLATTEDITNVEVGQQHGFSSSESAAVLRGTGGGSAQYLTVSGVNRSTGVITYSANVSTVTGGGGSVAAGDTIFLRGDRQDSATPTRLCVAGLEAWCPQTAPTSTAFFTVDRTSDVTRLGGQRLDGTGLPLEEVLVEGSAIVGREGFKLSHYFMSYGKWSALEKALGSKVVYDTVRATADIAFPTIVVNGARGPIKIVADQNCPGNRIFGVNMDHLKFHSLGQLIRTIDDDGNMLLRQSNADGVESRHGFMGNLACDAPASLINIKV
jgi:hypothetical protein